MSLQDALVRAKLDRMLRDQQEILLKSELKNKQPSDVVKAIRESENELEYVLKNGGVATVKVPVEGKLKPFKVSVKSNVNGAPKVPEYKFHLKTAMGFIMYICAKDRNTAQKVANEIFGKGQYIVSAAFI